MSRTEDLMKKWGPILEHEQFPEIRNRHVKEVTAQMLENSDNEIRAGRSATSSMLMNEAAPTNNTGQVDNHDPVLISMVRRSVPNMIAYDICGVQPMTGPTGLIFAMRSKYVDPANNANRTEAMYNEADTAFSGTGAQEGETGDGDVANTSLFDVGAGMSTAAAEALGDGVGDDFNEMSFDVDKVSVTAKSRKLKAEYTTELAQDFKAIHGLSAEAELANMLSIELLNEINREVVRNIYRSAKPGSQQGTATAGVFDLDVDANGTWSVEKFKGLMFQVEREANAVGKQTRRGKGNIVICSSDVASALQMAGMLDYAPALNNQLDVDDTSNTFAGLLNRRFKVYIDPFAGPNYMVVGYKGQSSWDAGLFYCPYVPLQMVRAVGENSFQPKIGFMTRYGMVANPFAEGATNGAGAINNNSNVYYRRTIINNLL